jgi:hypothetical protein
MRNLGPSRAEAHRHVISGNCCIQQSAHAPGAILHAEVVTHGDQVPTRFVSNTHAWGVVNEKRPATASSPQLDLTGDPRTDC